MSMTTTTACDELRAEVERLQVALRDMQADRDEWCQMANRAVRAQIKAEDEVARLHWLLVALTPTDK